MQIKTILFPTDFSQGARAAMDYAIALAQDYKAKLILLYVIQDISIAEWYIPSSISAADLVEDMQKSASREMEKWGAEAAAKVKDVEKSGRPGRALCGDHQDGEGKERRHDRHRHPWQDRHRPHALRQHCGKGRSQIALPGAHRTDGGKRIQDAVSPLCRNKHQYPNSKSMHQAANLKYYLCLKFALLVFEDYLGLGI